MPMPETLNDLLKLPRISIRRSDESKTIKNHDNFEDLLWELLRFETPEIRKKIQCCLKLFHRNLNGEKILECCKKCSFNNQFQDKFRPNDQLTLMKRLEIIARSPKHPLNLKARCLIRNCFY